MNLTLPRNITTGATAITAKRSIGEVRRLLSHETDRVAPVAEQLIRETGKLQTRVLRDACPQITTAAIRLTTRGRKTARDLGHDVKSLAGEMRRVRLTTEPRRSGPNLLPGLALVGGIGAGIGLMYLLDPKSGARRRAALRDRIMQLMRIGRQRATGTASEFRNRTVGVMDQARQAVRGAGTGIEASESMHEPIMVNGHGVGYGEPMDTSDRFADEEARVIIG